MFRVSKFKVLAALPGDDLVVLQSEEAFTGAVPLLARTYEESEKIRKTGQCYAFGYGLGPTGKLGFQSRAEMLQNDIHRGQGPIQFGFTVSSGLKHLIGKSPLLEHNKSTGPGDSGGGLICNSPSGHEYLIGVHKRVTQSFLPDRCMALNVSYYNEWLFKALTDHK